MADLLLVNGGTSDEDWTTEWEAIAKRTLYQSNGFAWIYENMATLAKQWSDSLNIVSSMLGGAIGTMSLIFLSAENSIPLWAHILQIVLGFLITVISILTTTWRLNESQMNNVLTQVSFATLAKDIMCQLAQPRRNRANANDYMRAKLAEFEQFRRSAEIISQKIQRAYAAKFRDNPIYSPEELWSVTSKNRLDDWVTEWVAGEGSLLAAPLLGPDPLHKSERLRLSPEGAFQ